MYVCIEVAFVELPMELGDPNGDLGEGPIGIVGPMSQLCGTIYTSSLTSIRTNADMHFPNQLYSRQLRVTCFLICRGAEKPMSRKQT